MLFIGVAVVLVAAALVVYMYASVKSLNVRFIRKFEELHRDSSVYSYELTIKECYNR